MDTAQDEDCQTRKIPAHTKEGEKEALKGKRKNIIKKFICEGKCLRERTSLVSIKHDEEK